MTLQWRSHRDPSETGQTYSISRQFCFKTIVEDLILHLSLFFGHEDGRTS